MFRFSVKNTFCLASQQFVLQKTLQNCYHQKHTFSSKCITSRLVAGLRQVPAAGAAVSPDPLAGLRSGPPGKGRGKGNDARRNGDGRVEEERWVRKRVEEGKDGVEKGRGGWSGRGKEYGRGRWGGIVQF